MNRRGRIERRREGIVRRRRCGGRREGSRNKAEVRIGKREGKKGKEKKREGKRERKGEVEGKREGERTGIAVGVGVGVGEGVEVEVEVVLFIGLSTLSEECEIEDSCHKLREQGRRRYEIQEE